jgi:RNA recognition motif-containing protein
MFVSGFPFAMREADISRKFEAYGKVVEVRLARENSGRSRGFGFVALSSVEEVDRAVAAENGTDWDGRTVKVERAKSVR